MFRLVWTGPQKNHCEVDPLPQRPFSEGGVKGRLALPRASKRSTRFRALAAPSAVPGPRAEYRSVTEKGGHTGPTDPLPLRPGTRAQSWTFYFKNFSRVKEGKPPRAPGRLTETQTVRAWRNTHHPPGPRGDVVAQLPFDGSVLSCHLAARELHLRRARRSDTGGEKFHTETPRAPRHAE